MYVNIRSEYKDLGLVIDATNMAAGTTSWSDWFEDMSWIRHFMFITQSDQTSDIIIQCGDDSITDYGSTVMGSMAANAGAWVRRTLSVGTGASANGVSALVGKKFRIGLKNSSASPNTYGRVRLQVMGL